MSDKTEPPSQKKLRDARKKGQVVQSKEVASAALILSVLAFLGAVSSLYYTLLERLILLPTSVIGPNFNFKEALPEVVTGAFMLFAQISVPPLLLVIVVAIGSHFFQYGLLFSFETAKPSLKKLNPAGSLKKMFSMKNVFELIKSIIKIGFLSVLIYLVIRNAIPELIKLPYCGEGCIPALLGHMMKQLVIYSAFAFVAIAAADYVFQRFQFMKQMKMSKDEVKREYKEMEGNPEIKGRRRQLHQELLAQSVVRSVKRSTVVVINPTHIAVALEYKDGETPLPVVRAKGENLVAKRIIEIAEQEGIPILQNIPLAHALNEQSTVDRYIPVDLIEAVAEVLRWVAQLEHGGR
jgi:type III secretion protein U